MHRCIARPYVKKKIDNPLPQKTTTKDNLLHKMRKKKRRKKLWKVRLGNLQSQKEGAVLESTR